VGIILVGAGLGLALLLGTLWTVDLLAKGPPPEPDPDAVEEVHVDYRCAVCGMRLTVTAAQDVAPEPPRHCREPMVAL